MYESTYGDGVQPVMGGDACPAPAGFALFNPRSVALATFFGSPAAGSVLLALNYKRMGARGRAAAVLAVGFGVTAVAIAVGFAAPAAVTYPMALVLLVATRLIAEQLQGPAVAQHVSQGGRLASKWTATAVGVAFFVVILLAVMVPVYAQSAGSKVTIGTNDEVFYSGTATKAEAEALGAELKTDGYFKDRGTSVFLDKGKDGTTISLVVKDGVWDKPGILMQEEEVAREVAGAVGGLPIHVRVTDKEQRVKKQGIVGRVSGNGKDEVFYFGDAMESQAKAIDAALQKEAYFGGRGVSVMFSQDGDGKAIEFVVGEAFGKDPEHVAQFVTLVKAIAPAMNGLPVTMRLVNASLEDETVQVVQ